MPVEFRDYYEVLGVSRDASKDAIKAAYRRLARKHHPDLHQGKARPQAEETFKAINEAHAVLSDPDKRARYDQLGPNGKAGGNFTQSPEGSSTGRGEYRDPGGGDGAAYSDFFASLFGRQRGQHRTRQPIAGRDIETDLSLELEEASRGGRRSVTVEGSEDCQICGGTGLAGDRVCQACGGQGAVGKPRTLEVQIPPGAREGTRLRLAGQGEPGRNGGPAGDLFFVVRVRPHRLYRVSGDDLEIDLPVYPWEAAVGTEVEVPTLEGPVALKVSPGAPAGRRLRLRGKGLARRNGSRGDLYARLRLVLPATLTDEQRRLLEQVGRLTTDNPRQWQ
jgi:DnaJ-class molecular chaperone